MEISVEGGERIGTSQLRIQSGLRIGQPWDATVRTEAVQALRALPGLRDIEVRAERVRPGRVRVYIKAEEREPYGVIALAGRGLFWADREGYLLEPLAGEPYLPVMVGVSVTLTPQGERVAPHSALRAFQEFFALEGWVLSRFRQLRFRDYDLELQDHAGRRVLLPPRGLRRHLMMLERVSEALDLNWQTLDLRFEGEVVLRP